MAVKYIYQHFPLQLDLGISGMKIYHLATLVLIHTYIVLTNLSTLVSLSPNYVSTHYSN
jgi:hypothetical protein